MAIHIKGTVPNAGQYDLCYEAHMLPERLEHTLEMARKARDVRTIAHHLGVAAAIAAHLDDAARARVQRTRCEML